MNTQREPTFKRKSRIGLSILELQEDKSVFVEIQDSNKFVTRDGREIDRFIVTNLITGEEQTLWIDGGMKGQLSTIGGPKEAINKQFEITFKGKVEFEGVNEDTGKPEMRMVNKYDIFEIELILA